MTKEVPRTCHWWPQRHWGCDRKKLSEQGITVVTAQRGKDPDHPWIAADFMDPEVPKYLISEVIAQYGQLDMLVNKAGLMREGTAEETSEADWAATIQVNLTAPFMLIKHAIPHLIKTQGSILNIDLSKGWDRTRATRLLQCLQACMG